MKLLLFDIDGTLLLTGGAGRVAFEKTYEEIFGLQGVWKNIDPSGKTDFLIIQELSQKALGRDLNQHEYDQVCERYVHYFRSEIHVSENFRLMPGVSELLDILSAEDRLALGIATGNFEVPAWLKLQRANLKDYFSFGGFASDADHRSELTKIAAERGMQKIGQSLTPEQVYVIGDTVHDINAGRSIGAKTIAVATGNSSVKGLGEHNPDHLLEDFSDPQIFLDCIKGS